MAKEQVTLPEDDDRIAAATLRDARLVSSGRSEGEDADNKARPPRRSVWVFLSALSGPAAEADGRIRESQGLLWWSFAFAAGIAVYNLLPQEPHWPVMGGLSALVLALAVWAVRHGTLGRSAGLTLALACGLTVAAARTAIVDAPRLGEPMTVTLTGHVLESGSGVRGTRVLLEVETVDGLPLSAVSFPGKVRLRVPAGSHSRVGDGVRVRARLFPPAGPVSPGGYDFSYRAFFSGIGATGFSYGPATPFETGEPSLSLRMAAQVQRLRDGLTDGIRSALPDTPERALIIALLVGDRSGISQEQEDQLRAAGLAHILAISGLHMALFAGGAYGSILMFLALFPSLALRWPTHKWAALVALGAAAAYLFISGAAVATQRSFLMIALVFLGIFTGRRGLTLRSVALAGLFLLFLAPERLFFPGFQMSFAAVICLVAVYDQWRARSAGWQSGSGREEARSAGRGLQLLRFVGKWAAGLVVTAFVAGLATGIIGAHHFGRIAPYGLLGNLLGMPVFSLLVMPMGVLALVVMPLGLAALPLHVMAFGLSVLQKTAAFTAELGADAGAVGTLNGMSALLLLSSLFIALLISGRWRLSAIVPFATALALIDLSRPPDIQIAASGQVVAGRDEAGILRISSRRKTFQAELWLQREGVPEGKIESRAMKSPQRQCDRSGCVVLAHSAQGERAAGNSAAHPVAMAIPKTPQALSTDCRYADIIVSDLIAPAHCGAQMVFDRDVRHRRGAISVWLSDPDPSGGDPPDVSGSGKPEIGRVDYAIPDPPRPWHKPGSVTRASLRRMAKRGPR
ncbi:ComEC/Rec2 family competence protein [Labrenzia sp. 011]|uniref:ComEC/Rec2 family competence protein n=1 Tax=Labrenzia sp. 011 TaxID=2171494 RepID=UPI00140387B8|nr:ComEC/Rec2 family competence protein [Labrenzia sp. 011]